MCQNESKVRQMDSRERDSDPKRVTRPVAKHWPFGYYHLFDDLFRRDRVMNTQNATRLDNFLVLVGTIVFSGLNNAQAADVVLNNGSVYTVNAAQGSKAEDKSAGLQSDI